MDYFHRTMDKYTSTLEIPLSQTIFADAISSGMNIRPQLTNFLGSIGYDIVLGDKDSAYFKAGGGQESYPEGDPRNASREVRIKINPESIICEFAVDLSGEYAVDKIKAVGFLRHEINVFDSLVRGTARPDGNGKPFKSLFPTLAKIFVAVLTLSPIIYKVVDSLHRELGGMNLKEQKVEQARSGYADVYLLPFHGFDEGLAMGLAHKLGQDLNISVRVCTSLPMPGNSFNDARQQHAVEPFYKPEIDAAAALLDTKKDTVFIGLLDGSMYVSNSPMRFLFAIGFDEKFFLVGNYEIKNGVPERIYHERLYKLVKRQIGKAFYKKKPTSNPDSLMRSPMMSTRDLDEAGTEFLP